MKKAIHAGNPNDIVVCKPMADGGEGTLESMLYSAGGEKVYVSCTGPLGEKRTSWYVLLRDGTAVIECANVAGLLLVPASHRHPDHVTTYGIGEMIAHALDSGCTNLMITLGGSSSNDGGLGMLQALGMQAYDCKGDEVGIYGVDLFDVQTVDFSRLHEKLHQSVIYIASDVENPLTGPKGASYVYGPQKGATSEQVRRYDEALAHYGACVEAKCSQSLMMQPGAGAAGGLGFALMVLGGEIRSGANLVAEMIGLKEAIEDADVVITGEGQSDDQTAYGKAPSYVAELAREHNVPTILLSGSLAGDRTKLNDRFTACFSIVPGPATLTECMERAKEYIYQSTYQVRNIWSCKKDRD